MSSSESNERQVVSSNESDAGDDGVVHVNTITVPYQYEPLAEGLTDDEEGGRARIAEEADEDGLSLAAIERRFERVENVNEWYVELPFWLNYLNADREANECLAQTNLREGLRPRQAKYYSSSSYSL